ncbi:hypothetical protein [Pseudomonas sp. H3(2019)]|uniref:PIN-like domain-containing protein n=1 Tax=Pseudomonas sp. H3(2019) TaxID=2598724 RepID=UPI00119369B7|nr:hypothetical protein [Pseudomonas sp. H3(2019)]TVT84568.1 hypothetical protein FPT12_08295 [Pseudomonas sp. H3(2019)]
MNFLLDNNLPPALARALNELSKSEGHTVTPLRDKFPQSTSDMTWISTLSEEGGWAVISDLIRGGAAFRVPWKFATHGKLDQMKI